MSKWNDNVNVYTVHSLVRFDIVNKMYEHFTAKKQVIIDCGKELHSDGEFNAMINLNSYVNSIA